MPAGFEPRDLHTIYHPLPERDAAMTPMPIHWVANRDLLTAVKIRLPSFLPEIMIRLNLTFVSDLAMLKTLEATLNAAVRTGALVRYLVDLEQGELSMRQLWLRPEIGRFMNSEQIHPQQRAVVNAALRRFVTGGRFIVITKECVHREITPIGDIRELKGLQPPFLELRFKPPRHDLRFFGRCVGRDKLLLTSFGVKSLTDATGERPLLVSEHRNRCRDSFKLCGLNEASVPVQITGSFSNAEYV
jgi:hypothetical protein